VSSAMRAAIVWLGALLLQAAPAGAAPHGKVWLLVNPQAAREDWQRRPLSGAFVVLDWTVRVPAPASAVAYCRYSELARTDDRGEYVMEGPNVFTALAGDVSFFAYSPGMEVIPFRYPGARLLPEDITMTMSTRTAQQRLSYLSLATDPGCPLQPPNDPHALFVPYLRALLDEANTLAPGVPSGRGEVEHIEAELRHATGQDRPPRVLRVVPYQGGVEAATPVPPAPAAAQPAR
jgi:hypothetical protein